MGLLTSPIINNSTATLNESSLEGFSPFHVPGLKTAAKVDVGDESTPLRGSFTRCTRPAGSTNTQEQRDVISVPPTVSLHSSQRDPLVSAADSQQESGFENNTLQGWLL